MPERNRIANEDYAILASFRAALRSFLQFSSEAAGASGLTPAQHQALLAIKGFGREDGLSVGDIARILALRHHSAVGLVDRLAKAGLARRRPDPSDGRRVRVALTRKGERILERLSAAHRDELRRLRPALQELLAKLG